jgi:hypothetical protein
MPLEVRGAFDSCHVDLLSRSGRPLDRREPSHDGEARRNIVESRRVTATRRSKTTLSQPMPLVKSLGVRQQCSDASVALPGGERFVNPFPQIHPLAIRTRYGPAPSLIDVRGELEMTQDLAYDMTLEVRGLIRSLAVRTRYDGELRIGETFSLRGRRWVVCNVRDASREDLDRRVIAREVDVDDAEGALTTRGARK